MYMAYDFLPQVYILKIFKIYFVVDVVSGFDIEPVKDVDISKNLNIANLIAIDAIGARNNYTID